MKYRLSNFGPLVKHYEKARRPYPKEIPNFIKSNLPPNPLILDLGCGTGISTRQISHIGKVIGCDPDKIMLGIAKNSKTKNVKYIIGSANRLPLKSSTFDAVTAFAAFHWFNDKKSIREINRVLKPGGKIFVINKIGLPSWGEGYRKALIRVAGTKVAPFRKGSAYTPWRTLRDNGFKNIRVRSWKKSELYTIKEALDYVQSVSIWNSVPINFRPAALSELKKYFTKIKQSRGKIERKLDAKLVIGIK